MLGHLEGQVYQLADGWQTPRGLVIVVQYDGGVACWTQGPGGARKVFFSLDLCALWEIFQVEGRKSGLQ